MKYTIEDVRGQLAILGTVAERNSQSQLLAIHLFGGTVRGDGNDIDVILEVPFHLFEGYAGDCITVYDGIHPTSKEGKMPRFYGAAWDYFAPKGKRTKLALETAIPHTEISLGSKAADFDIICLPNGWQEPESSVSLVLNAFLGESGDPLFLENVRRRYFTVWKRRKQG